MLPPPGFTTPSAPALLPGPGATACTRGTSSVTRRPRWGATPAEKRGNRRLGRLPMRNGSQQGKAHPCESANSCIYNICYLAPGDENPRCAGTFCGIVYQLCQGMILLSFIAWMCHRGRMTRAHRATSWPLKVRRVKPLGAPAIDRRARLTGGGALAPLLSQPRQAHSGVQLQGFRLLVMGHVEGMTQTGCGLGSNRLAFQAQCYVCFDRRATRPLPKGSGSRQEQSPSHELVLRACADAPAQRACILPALGSSAAGLGCRRAGTEGHSRGRCGIIAGAWPAPRLALDRDYRAAAWLLVELMYTGYSRLHPAPA
jgi:hypothetical protein